MDELELRKAGRDLVVGGDLYGLSVSQLDERVDILQHEITRIRTELTKKQAEKSAAEQFFKKP